MENTMDETKTDGAKSQEKKPYVKPQLRVIGDLRTLTLGGSPGGGDSNPPGPEVSLP